jgi:hypothetical protein
MFRCYSCGISIREERDKLGARCPHCRAPLYEKLYNPHEPPPYAGAHVGSRCAQHARNPAVGTCARCGNYLCRVCRTRWRNRPTCIACVERALQANETPPEEIRAHRRQAILGLILGGIGWLIALGGFVLAVIGANEADPQIGLAIIGLLLVVVSPTPAMFGIGQGAAAVRARGRHMILATIGLVLCGLHLGIMIGAFTFLVMLNEH